jgi:hypothetical protein
MPATLRISHLLLYRSPGAGRPAEVAALLVRLRPKYRID